MSTAHTTGAVIARVEPDSPAERAGLRTGDLVVSANGVPVRSGTQLRNVIGLSGVGSAVDLRIDRRGSEHSVAVNVEAARTAATRRGAQRRSQEH
jgi:serine protease Do